VHRLPEYAIRRPRVVLAAAAALTLLAAAGAARLRLRTDGHALVPADDPAVQLDASVRREFGLQDPLVVLLRARHRDGIYNPATLRLVADLTSSLGLLPGVDPGAVRSLATEVADRFRPGTLERRRLLEPVPETAEQIDALRGDVEAIGLLAGTLISDDGASTAILVGVPRGSDASALVVAAQDALARADTAGHDVAVLGAPAAEALLGLHILEDLGIRVPRGEEPDAFPAPAGERLGALSRLRALAARVGLLPIAIAIMALVFLLGFRSLSATLLPLLEAAACLAFVFGVMGWCGMPVYLTMAVLPVILVSMGLADEIHVFTAYRRRRGERRDEPAEDSVRAALDETALPVLATGLTTCVGFLAFAVSPLPPVRAFGVMTAIGIAFCLIWTLTVVPALLVSLPERRPAAASAPRPVPAPPARWIRVVAGLGRRPAVTLSVAGAALLLSPLAIRRVVVQDSWIAGFAPGSPFHRATTYFNERFAGAHRLLLVVDTGHVDLRGPLAASDLDFLEIRLPEGTPLDPADAVGCSLAVIRRPEPGAEAASDRPSLWSSFVEAAESREGRTVLRTPPRHGSARFLLRPAPADTLEFVLRSQRLAVPAVLRRLEALEAHLRGLGLTVGGVLGPPDHLAAAEFLTSDRAEGSRGIPSDPDRVRWLWTSLERVVGADRVREIVDAGRRRGVITVFLGDANYADTARLMAAVRAWEREHLRPERIRLEFAGDVAVSQALIGAIVRSQVGSLLGSLLGVAAVGALLFGSLRRGLLCTAPAALAVGATFAVMGAVGMPLGVATSMFASMVLGIGVDFAIHLVERYRRVRDAGATHEEAVLGSLSATGPAIVINALAVTLGFGVLVLSRVPANAWLGAITVVSLAACLAATLLVVPPLLGLGGSRDARR
jgi:predicted RND superfamily exporter protein